eukprot:scaffold81730_cov54-Phaeocystis_antarctica.AAC.3
MGVGTAGPQRWTGLLSRGPHDSAAGTVSASILVTISSRLARSSSCCLPSAAIEPATAHRG